MLVLPLVRGSGPLRAAAPDEFRELTTAAEVRRLTAGQAAQRQPVRLRGVVTFFKENLYSRFIQDETAGIYLQLSTNTPQLEPGQLVEIEGTTSPGEYAPIIDPVRVRMLGEAPLPPAKPATFEQLSSGQEDSQFVAVQGIVRSVQFDEGVQHYLITLATGGGRLTVYAQSLPVAGMDALVDATVRVRGVCSSQFNRQRQLFAIRLMVPRPDDLTVVEPAATDPFAVPASSIGSLLQFAPHGSYGHRVKLGGAVVYHQPGVALYIQDGHNGLLVQTRQRDPLQVGDAVEVLGFPHQGAYTPVLEDAVYRTVRPGPPPTPTPVTVDIALSGVHDCRLVRLEAKLLDRARQSQEQFLVLEADNFIFQAHLDTQSGDQSLTQLQKGSRLAITGICLIEPGEWQAGENWRARSFRLLLRSPADAVVLQAPPWLTLQKLLWIVGLLAAGVIAATVWVAVLRRRVQQQTGIIRQQLDVEATLKERYLDLFENANDMVFTHDLNGRITSINQTGERLLQRRRENLLSHNLLDLIAEEQRAAARHWLDQVVQGAELPTAEWDFLNSAGQRVKLEISSRVIEQNGKPPEVEGIARDITERRRLERELIEISNREQRRIGHDLHDGVCQQLAAIGYRVDILADELQAKGPGFAEEAERIGALINEATAQARGVARGLFPVRLEESGLISALDELAASAAKRFKVDFLFECQSPPAAVDNEAALHLYYIAQEALLNAVKHGKATHVRVSLKPDEDRFKLVIQDNGQGFRPPGGRPGGMGIRIMRHRAKVIGATLDVFSEPGRGAEVTCSFLPASRESLPKPSNDV
jgi:PAS domain S-box-containing protein